MKLTFKNSSLKRTAVKIGALACVIILLIVSIASAFELTDIVGIGLAYTLGASIARLMSAAALLVLGYFVQLNPCVYAPPGGFCTYHPVGTTVNIAPNDVIRNLNRLEMQWFITFYVVAIILIGIYIIFMNGSPQGRAKAKDMLVRIFIGMIFTSFSPTLFQMMLNLADYANTNLMGQAWANFRQYGFFVFSSLGGELVKYCCIFLILGLIFPIALATAGLRYLLVFATACFFPVGMFLYFFNFPNPFFSFRSLGRSIIKVSMIAVVTQTIQVAALAITLISFSMNVGTMMSFLLAIGGIIGICFSPMITMQLMPWLGAMVHVASTRPSTAGSRFIASMMRGQGIARSLETSSGQTMIGRNMGEFAGGATKAPEGSILPFGVSGGGGLDYYGKEDILSHPMDSIGRNYGDWVGSAGVGRTASRAGFRGGRGQARAPGAGGAGVPGGGGPAAAGPGGAAPGGGVAGAGASIGSSPGGAARGGPSPGGGGIAGGGAFVGGPGQAQVGGGGGEPAKTSTTHAGGGFEAGPVSAAPGAGATAGGVIPRAGGMYDDRQKISSFAGSPGAGGGGGMERASSQMPGSVVKEPSSAVGGGTTTVSSPQAEMGGGQAPAGAPGFGGGGDSTDAEWKKEQQMLAELRRKASMEKSHLNQSEQESLNRMTAESLRAGGVANPQSVVSAGGRVPNSLGGKSPAYTAKSLPEVVAQVEKESAARVASGKPPLSPEEKTERILHNIHKSEHAPGEKSEIERMMEGPARSNLLDLSQLPYPATAFERIMSLAGDNPNDRRAFARSGQMSTIVNNARRYVGEGYGQEEALEKAMKPYAKPAAMAAPSAAAPSTAAGMGVARGVAGANVGVAGPAGEVGTVGEIGAGAVGGVTATAAGARAQPPPLPPIIPFYDALRQENPSWAGYTDQQIEGAFFQQRIANTEGAVKMTDHYLKDLNSTDPAKNLKAREWLADQLNKSKGGYNVTPGDLSGVRWEMDLTPEYEAYMRRTGVPYRVPGILVVPDEFWNGGPAGKEGISLVGLKEILKVEDAGGVAIGNWGFEEKSPLSKIGLQFTSKSAAAHGHEQLHQIDRIVAWRLGGNNILSEIYAFRGDMYSGKPGINPTTVNQYLREFYVNYYEPNATPGEKAMWAEKATKTWNNVMRMDGMLGQSATSRIIEFTPTLSGINDVWGKMPDDMMKKLGEGKTGEILDSMSKEQLQRIFGTKPSEMPQTHEEFLSRLNKEIHEGKQIKPPPLPRRAAAEPPPLPKGAGESGPEAKVAGTPSAFKNALRTGRGIAGWSAVFSGLDAMDTIVDRPVETLKEMPLKFGKAAGVMTGFTIVDSVALRYGIPAGQAFMAVAAPVGIVADAWATGAKVGDERVSDTQLKVSAGKTVVTGGILGAMGAGAAFGSEAGPIGAIVGASLATGVATARAFYEPRRIRLAAEEQKRMEGVTRTIENAMLGFIKHDSAPNNKLTRDAENYIERVGDGFLAKKLGDREWISSLSRRGSLQDWEVGRFGQQVKQRAIYHKNMEYYDRRIAEAERDGDLYLKGEFKKFRFDQKIELDHNTGEIAQTLGYTPGDFYRDPAQIAKVDAVISEKKQLEQSVQKLYERGLLVEHYGPLAQPLVRSTDLRNFDQEFLDAKARGELKTVAEEGKFIKARIPTIDALLGDGSDGGNFVKSEKDIQERISRLGGPTWGAPAIADSRYVREKAKQFETIRKVKEEINTSVLENLPKAKQDEWKLLTGAQSDLSWPQKAALKAMPLEKRAQRIEELLKEASVNAQNRMVGENLRPSDAAEWKAHVEGKKELTPERRRELAERAAQNWMVGENLRPDEAAEWKAHLAGRKGLTVEREEQLMTQAARNLDVTNYLRPNDGREWQSNVRGQEISPARKQALAGMAASNRSMLENLSGKDQEDFRAYLDGRELTDQRLWELTARANEAGGKIQKPDVPAVSPASAPAAPSPTTMPVSLSSPYGTVGPEGMMDVSPPVAERAGVSHEGFVGSAGVNLGEGVGEQAGAGASFSASRPQAPSAQELGRRTAAVAKKYGFDESKLRSFVSSIGAEAADKFDGLGKTSQLALVGRLGDESFTFIPKSVRQNPRGHIEGMVLETLDRNPELATVVGKALDKGDGTFNGKPAMVAGGYIGLMASSNRLAEKGAPIDVFAFENQLKFVEAFGNAAGVGDTTGLRERIKARYKMNVVANYFWKNDIPQIISPGVIDEFAAKYPKDDAIQTAADRAKLAIAFRNGTMADMGWINSTTGRYKGDDRMLLAADTAKFGILYREGGLRNYQEVQEIAQRHPDNNDASLRVRALAQAVDTFRVTPEAMDGLWSEIRRQYDSGAKRFTLPEGSPLKTWLLNHPRGVSFEDVSEYTTAGGGRVKVAGAQETSIERVDAVFRRYREKGPDGKTEYERQVSASFDVVMKPLERNSGTNTPLYGMISNMRNEYMTPEAAERRMAGELREQQGLWLGPWQPRILATITGFTPTQGRTQMSTKALLKDVEESHAGALDSLSSFTVKPERVWGVGNYMPLFKSVTVGAIPTDVPDGTLIDLHELGHHVHTIRPDVLERYQKMREVGISQRLAETETPEERAQRERYRALPFLGFMAGFRDSSNPERMQVLGELRKEFLFHGAADTPGHLMNLSRGKLEGTALQENFAEDYMQWQTRRVYQHRVDEAAATGGDVRKAQAEMDAAMRGAGWRNPLDKESQEFFDREFSPYIRKTGVKDRINLTPEAAPIPASSALPAGVLDAARRGDVSTVKEYLSDPSNRIDRPGRLQLAEALLGRRLSQEEGDAVWAAHEVGGEIGRVSRTQLTAKVRALKEVVTDEGERRMLIEAGIAGAAPVAPAKPPATRPIVPSVQTPTPSQPTPAPQPTPQAAPSVGAGSRRKVEVPPPILVPVVTKTGAVEQREVYAEPPPERDLLSRKREDGKPGIAGVEGGGIASGNKDDGDYEIVQVLCEMCGTYFKKKVPKVKK